MPPSRRDFHSTRCMVLAGLLITAALAGSAYGAEDAPVTLTIVPVGSTASGKPLPPGATGNLRIILRNGDAKALTGLTLVVRTDGLKAEAPPGWQAEADALVATLARLNAGATVERRLSLPVDKPPPAPGISRRITIEARAGNAALATAEFALPVADCATAYHARLGAIRTGALQAVKAEAEAIRRTDPAFPYSRLFPTVGGRTGELAKVERLATAFVNRAGADGELAGEDLRFNFQLWASDLTAYTGQDKHPALCSGSLDLVKRYRQNIAPTTRRLDAVRAAAASALELARKAVDAEPQDDLARVAQRAIEKAGLTATTSGDSALAALAAARTGLDPDRKLAPEATQALSLVETAAVLAAAAARGDKFSTAIDAMLAAIGDAARETCVCAY